jgi:hypothetical protein
VPAATVVAGRADSPAAGAMFFAVLMIQ